MLHSLPLCTERRHNFLSQRTFPSFGFSDPNKNSATDTNISSVKAFRNLVSGDDDKLSDAYKRFHKMVEQEQGAVRNATLVAVGQLQKETTAIQVGMRESLAITERIDLNAETLMASTERLQTYLERTIILRLCPSSGI